MIVAVLLDGDGRPVCSEMWAGNTADVTTLIPVIDRLRRRFDLGPLAAGLCYKQLWTVEQTFRTAKHLLSTRPIFHKLDETIRGHVFCSFLALLLIGCLFVSLPRVQATLSGSCLAGSRSCFRKDGQRVSLG
jgi:transposase